MVLNNNRDYSEKYVQKVVAPKVPPRIRGILDKNDIKSMIDLGCGDGILICATKKEFPELDVTGVDISPRRIGGLKKRFPEDKFYVKDVCNTELKKKFDFVHASQVIEHVSSDKEMVQEMSRLLKKDGILYCSSVIKKPWAIYQYRNNGKFVLDPTHEREYRNKDEFLDLFKKDFKLLKCITYPVVMPKFGLAIKIPGYHIVEGIWEKRE